MSKREEFLNAVQHLSGVSISGDTVSIRPRNTHPKLRANRNGKGYVTSYTLSIGCAEARRLGFIDEDGTPLGLTKHIDEAAHTLIVRVAES